MSRRVTVIAAATLVGAAALSACSSSSPSTSSATTAAPAAPASTPAAPAGGQSGNGTPIKVGLLCSCSGPFGASTSIGADVFKAWAKQVNAAGGLSGHPIDITFMDNSSNPGTAVTNAQTVISDHVDVIFDVDTLDEVWSKLASAAKIPVVGGVFSTPMYYTDPDFYPSGETQDSVVMASVLTTKASGATSFGELYCAEAPSCAEGVPLRKAAAKKVGIADVYDASISATAPNYTAQCVAAKQAGAKALYIGGSSTTIATIGENCAQQGFEPIFVQNGTGFTSELLTATGVKDHLWDPFPDLPYFVNSPAVTAMNTAVDKYYPGLRHETNTWSELGLESWTGGLLLADAIKGANVTATSAISPSVITSGLDSIKNDTLDGLSPPLTFTAGKPHGVDCWFTARVSGGKPSLVDGGKLTCANPS